MGHIKKTLSDYAKSGILRLHMPGHKGRMDASDITEIPQTDDLNSPEGPYLKALEHLSQVYHSEKSYFITNGATLGIQAMVLYAKITGLKVVAMRSSHMSVVNACLAFGAECNFIAPEFDEETGSYKSAEEALAGYLDSTNEKCAVIVTSPDYFGRCIDIEKVFTAAKKSGSKIFCDEAHGAHFIFSAKLPENAGKYCSLWVNGAHKTMGALTQGAFFHSAKDIDRNVLAKVMRTLNTSSPSSIIAASLEEAVLESEEDAWEKRADEANTLCEKINTLSYIKCADIRWANSAGYNDKDVTRLVLDAKDAGGGYRLFDLLYKKHNIQMEMADFRYAVAILTIYDSDDADIRLLEALKELDEYLPSESIQTPPRPGERKMDIADSWYGKIKRTSFEKSAGMISAGVLGAYPPGTALLLPGEVIEKQHVDYMKNILSAGGHVFGMYSGKIDTADI